jgi:hypothetical protein
VNVDRYPEMTEKVRFSNMTGTVALSSSMIAANAAAQRFLTHVLVLERAGKFLLPQATA